METIIKNRGHEAIRKKELMGSASNRLMNSIRKSALVTGDWE